MNNNIINEIIPNSDEYCWKDLTCTYRPWMTAFKSFGNNYESAFLLLMSYVAIYIDDIEDKKILDLVLYYEKYIEKYMGIAIEKYKFSNLQEMVTCIKKAIDKRQPVLIPCDLIKLSYNPMYLLEHRYKCMIVKGYDIDRELLYILDNIHIDYGSSTILTDFTSLTSEMYEMNKVVAERLNYEQCIFVLNIFKNNDIREYTTLKYLCGLIRTMLSNKLATVHWEKKIIQIVKDSDYKRKIDEIVKILDFKHVFSDVLFKMLGCFESANKKDIIELKCEFDEINKKWENLRRRILHDKELNKSMIGFDDEISELEKDEITFMKKLCVLIDLLDDEHFQSNNSIDGFSILDNIGSKIIKTDRGIKIKHSKQKKYDTWTMQDNAVQLLIHNIHEGSIETRLDFNTGIGEDTHAGIIVKMKSGKKYLFGNVRGEHISIFCPEDGDKFDKYSRLSYIEAGNGDTYFKVDIEANNTIKFYCLDLLGENEECIFSIHENEEIEYVGLFSKTWEYLEHSVEFYDIKQNFV